jgi:hypothetical protein
MQRLRNGYGIFVRTETVALSALHHQSLELVRLLLRSPEFCLELLLLLSLHLEKRVIEALRGIERWDDVPNSVESCLGGPG